MASDDGTEVPTVAEPHALATGPRAAIPLSEIDEPPGSFIRGLAHEPPAEDEHQDTLPPDGLESQVLLARARSRLLGWDDQPVSIGRYRILEPIGSGGMGVVYAAQDDELDRAVAIKVLRRDLAPGSAGRQRLVREAQATAKLSHPNVVHVYEVGQSGDQVFMAMELVRGHTLRAWRKAEPRTWRDVVDIYMAAGEGLVAAHAEGIVHRDFKPDNVLVNREGRPQIVDFGLARATNDTGSIATTREMPAASSASRLRDFDITRTGTVVGTPAYMAPEQLARAEPDARSDQFSFCASMFEALYGKRPFAGSTYSELERSLTEGRITSVTKRGEVPRSIHAAVLRGLASNPDDRFPTMRALLDALARGRRARAPIGWAIGIVGSAVVVAAGVSMLPKAEGEKTPLALPAPAEAAAEDPWAAIVAASDLPPVIPVPLPGDPAQVSVHRLRNGLTIYVARRPHEPVVASALVLRAGPGQESPEARGLAMLATSAILSGTDRIGTLDAAAEAPLRQLQHTLLRAVPGPGDTSPTREILTRTIAASEQASATKAIESELFTAVSSLGGRDPLVIGRVGPTISAEVPRHRVGAWMQLHAEAVMRPVFREFQSVVAKRLEVMSWYAGNDRSGEELRRVLGESTGIPRERDAVIATLERLPLADVREFHDRYWRPNNAALVLVGDISAAEAVSLAEQSFGAWEPAPIPTRAAVDRPIPNGRVAIEIEDLGPPHIELGWPMPPHDAPEYDALVDFGNVLSGRNGLLDATLRTKVEGWGAHVGDSRDFNVFIMIGADQDAREAERLTLEALTSIAEDRIDDNVWREALTDARYEQLRWARGPGSLMLEIADTFLEHRAWTTGPGSPAAPAPTRAEMVAAAKTLLARGHAVVHKRTGKPPRVTTPTLPSLTRKSGPPQHGAFVRTLLDTPTPPTEPRFLVEGSHYETSMHGAGRVITTQTDSPLFHLSWIYPVGTAEDPWACEALRGRMRRIPVTGASVMVFCSTTDTRYDVTAAADRFAELMPPLLAWFDAGTLDVADAQRFADNAAATRAENREVPFLHATGAEFFGLLGDNALDLQLPSDAELRRRGGASIIAAFERMREYDPDVLYAGPDPAALRAALPEPKHKTLGGTYVRTYRRPQGPEVLVIDDPNPQDVTVRASLPWMAATPRDALAAAMHSEIVFDAERAAGLSPDPDALGYSVRFSPGPPIAIGLGFLVPHAGVPAAIDAALAGLRARPTRETFAVHHARLETAFRVDRTAPARIPELVHAWGPGATDPRVAQWLALPSLDYDDVIAYYDVIDEMNPVIVVCGDTRRIDLGALARFGKIVRIDAAEVINDQMVSGFGRDMPLLVDE